jgi:hydrogenase expression/formation protein HypE
MSTTTSGVEAGSWICPLPLRDYPAVVLGHGAGGRLMADLLDGLFRPLFANPILAQQGDAAVLDLGPAGRLAFTIDSFVVSPPVFPGGDIGSLAAHGTINDLAMAAAQPLALSAAFILEEGLPLDRLQRLAASLAAACRAAGVPLVSGDTKVVNRGQGDGVYITTAGIGLVQPGSGVAPQRARPGDAVLVSGSLGDHGVAVLSVRAGLAFETAITSDSAPLHTLVAALLAAAPDVHSLRDPTRGGLAAALNELAAAAGVGIVLEEPAIPVQPAVAAACELLGLDPLHLANEGKLVALVPPAQAEAALAALRAHPLGAGAARIGSVVAEHPGQVVARTAIGGTRLIDLPAGELLPRIC